MKIDNRKKTHLKKTTEHTKPKQRTIGKGHENQISKGEGDRAVTLAGQQEVERGFFGHCEGSEVSNTA